jgi:2Fe-2S ferredoxin
MAVHKVTFLPLGKTVEVDDERYPLADHGKPGSLLDIALAHDIPLEHNCGGSCACTTCHLYIRDGEQNLSEPEDKELDRLDTAWDLRTNSRLGCQAVIKGDVVVEFPMYTRNYVQEGGAIQLGKSDQTEEEKKAAGARP